MVTMRLIGLSMWDELLVSHSCDRQSAPYERGGDPVGDGTGGDCLPQTAIEDDPHAIESMRPFIEVGALRCDWGLLAGSDPSQP